MISSLIPGRIRIRYAALKNPGTAGAVEEGLNACPWVNRAAVNPLAGSLLIEYDAAQMDMETARRMFETIAPNGADWLEEYEAALGGGPPSQRPGRPGQGAAEYLAMTLAFVICAASAATRSRGLHVHSGLAWAGLTIQHLYKSRKRLLACLYL